MTAADEKLWAQFIRAAFGKTDHAEYMLHDMNPAERADMIKGLKAVLRAHRKVTP